MRAKLDESGRVPPEVMRLLCEIAGHRDVCPECEEAMQTGSGRYCATGRGLVLELAEQPGVDFAV